MATVQPGPEAIAKVTEVLAPSTPYPLINRVAARRSSRSSGPSPRDAATARLTERPSGGEDGAYDGLVAVDLDQSEGAGAAEGEGAGSEAEDGGRVGADGGVEVAEPVGEQVGRDAGQAVDQVPVAGGGDEELADDEQVPPVADEFEGSGEPASTGCSLSGRVCAGVALAEAVERMWPMACSASW
ncbi:hypothetical protein [Nonomuraea dietziae]|uniref:hypothetical protein n=1 Tax=Nonomuraea dietziae TaxID=65515 RepID=UPI003F4D6977